MLRRGMARGEINRIMDSQATEAQRLAVADDVIDNDGEIGGIKPRVAALHQTYLEWFG